MEESSILQRRRRVARPAPTPWPSARMRQRADADTGGRTQVDELHRMLATYGRAGGVATGEEVAGRMRDRFDRPVSQLARWIAERQVVSFTWGVVVLIPLFQFEKPAMARRPAVTDALAELRPFTDDWESALWFVQPNCWLDDGLPIDRLANQAPAVLQAARADRFVALG
jgi:hypothetical protein